MPTFTHELSPYKRRDGTCLVKVRIIHNRKTIRKPLGIYATASQLNRERDRIKDAALLEAVNAAVDRLRLTAAQVDGAAFMDAETLWRHIEAKMSEDKGFRLDLGAFAATLTAKMEKGTANGYKYALRAFFAFLGRDIIDVNEIDRKMVEKFRDWIEERNGKGCRAASAYLEKLRYIHNRARDIYNDEDTGVVRIPRQPFKGTIPVQPTSRHKSLTLNQLKKVIFSEPLTSRGRLARDVFALSFYLIGINTADLYKLRKNDLRDGVLTYNRAKTDSRRADKAEMRVRVEYEAAKLLSAYKGRAALLSFADRFNDAAHFNKACNVGLREVARLAGVGHLTTYHARHTWATLARNACGIDKDTVGEALNHATRGSERVTDIYIERDFSRVWDANRAVLDLLK